MREQSHTEEHFNKLMSYLNGEPLPSGQTLKPEEVPVVLAASLEAIKGLLEVPLRDVRVAVRGLAREQIESDLVFLVNILDGIRNENDPTFRNSEVGRALKILNGDWREGGNAGVLSDLQEVFGKVDQGSVDIKWKLHELDELVRQLKKFSEQQAKPAVNRGRRRGPKVPHEESRKLGGNISAQIASSSKPQIAGRGKSRIAGSRK